jgi:hypothetical protein
MKWAEPSLHLGASCLSGIQPIAAENSNSEMA